MSLGHLLADEGVDPGAHRLAYQEGVDGLPAGRQLVHHGDVQISVEDQSKRARDGCGGHNQKVRVLPFLGKRGALGHTKSVLLVGHDQAEVCKRS